MSHKNTKKGVTLVELITVLAVVAIIGMLAATAFSTAGREYGNILDVGRAKAAVNTMQEQLNNRLRYTGQNLPAGQAAAVTPADTGYGSFLYAEDGILKQTDGSDYFADIDGIYDGLQYEITFSAAGSDSVIFHFAAKRDLADAKAIYTADYTLHFLNASVTAASGSRKYLCITTA